VRSFQVRLAASGIRDVIAAELCLREPTDPERLNGCGLVIVNPPWQFESEARTILTALLDRLGDGKSGQRTALVRLVDE
jgi:23S rRNA (adenine2030-N6)-methyltransferase